MNELANRWQHGAMRKFRWSVAALLLCTGSAWSAGAPQPLTIERGVVESVAPGNPPTLTIDGLTYGFALDAKVELGGTRFGAPTLVHPNMKVEYHFTTQDDAHRTIVLLRELPPETRVPQS